MNNSTAHTSGRAAFSSGSGLLRNPFDAVTEEHNEWEAGWISDMDAYIDSHDAPMDRPTE